MLLVVSFDLYSRARSSTTKFDLDPMISTRNQDSRKASRSRLRRRKGGGLLLAVL